MQGMNAETESTIANDGWRAIGAWISRKRIAISLISFTCLIVFNLFVVRTNALDPFNYHQPLALLGSSLVLFGLFIRSWSAGMLYKTELLVTWGPYALIRNPLYVGSFFMMFGFCLLMRDWLALAFVVGPLAWIYWLQVLIEEERLSKRFNETWATYDRSTGRFVPRNCNRDICANWSLKQWIRNREYQALVVSWVALLALHCFYSVLPA